MIYISNKEHESNFHMLVNVNNYHHLNKKYGFINEWIITRTYILCKHTLKCDWKVYEHDINDMSEESHIFMYIYYAILTGVYKL